MTQVRELEIDLPHLRIAARAWGDVNQPRLLALHGWLDNAASFDGLAERLCDRFHIVAIDLAGHGHSSHRPSGYRYHLLDNLDDVLAVAQALRWERFGLLGHSLGAAIASLLAGAQPRQIERLWLVEALGPLTDDVDATAAVLGRALHERAASQPKPLRVFADLQAAAAARARSGDINPAAALSLCERGTRPVPDGLAWSSDPRLLLSSPLRLAEQQVRAILAAIVAPTLLVAAEPPSKFVHAEALRLRCEVVRGIRVRHICGGHHLHMERPREVAEAILDFESAHGQ